MTSIGGGAPGHVAGDMITDDPVVRRSLRTAAAAADTWLSILLFAAAAVLG
jgi:hypothetical protein